MVYAFAAIASLVVLLASICALWSYPNRNTYTSTYRNTTYAIFGISLALVIINILFLIVGLNSKKLLDELPTSTAYIAGSNSNKAPVTL